MIRLYAWTIVGMIALLLICAGRGDWLGFGVVLVVGWSCLGTETAMAFRLHVRRPHPTKPASPWEDCA